MGWAYRRRDHGGLVFVDLRDREGLTQCVFNPGAGGGAHAKAESVRAEFVLAVRGTVGARPAGTENPRLATGAVEVQVTEIRILNESRPLPFQLEDDADIDETLRLKYRYLDLRQPHMLRAFQIRDQVCRAARDYLHAQGFLEVETPFLTRSTPEGARDFLVPSRLQPGSFYALPQSPQLFKQLLMVAGFERYFPIVRCFRGEGPRRERPPEVTQIEIETPFLDRADFLPSVEGLAAAVWRGGQGVARRRPGRPAVAGRGRPRGRGDRARAAARGPGAAVRPDPGRSRRVRVGHRFPARRVERRREALGRGSPSVHRAARRGSPPPGVRAGKGPRQGLRPGAERPGGGGRLDPYPPAERAGAGLRPDRQLQGGRARALRFPARRARVRGAAHGRHRLRPGPAGPQPGGPGVDPGGHRVPQDAEGHLPAHRRARAGGRQAAPRAGDPGRVTPRTRVICCRAEA